ncbi:MAG: transcriptional regulator [Oligoflexales bacterium]
MDQNLQATVRQFLRTHFKEVVKKNHRYSIRALAKQIKVSPATLSRFLNGNRDISDDTLLKIMNKFKSTFSEQAEALIQSLQGKDIARGYSLASAPGSEVIEDDSGIVIIQETLYLSPEQASKINGIVREMVTTAKKNNAGTAHKLSLVLVPQN